MLEASRAVVSRTYSWFSVWLRQDGILVYRANAGAVITEQQAWDVYEAGLQLVEGRARRVLVMMEDIARVERGARECFASEDFLRVSYRTALLVGSPVSRVIGNFFIGLNRLKYPCRVFDDCGVALNWLRQEQAS